MQEYIMYTVKTPAGKGVCSTSYSPQGFHDAVTTAVVMAQSLGPCQLVRIQKDTLIEEIIVEMTSPMFKEIV